MTCCPEKQPITAILSLRRHRMLPKIQLLNPVPAICPSLLAALRLCGAARRVGGYRHRMDLCQCFLGNMLSVYQIFITCCMIRLTTVIPHQQDAPTIIGFPPVLMSCITLLFSPIAAIAIMIINLDSSLRG